MSKKRKGVDLETKLMEEIETLKATIDNLSNGTYPLYAHPMSRRTTASFSCMKEKGTSASNALQIIRDNQALDFKETLNTSSYVNIAFEPEEEEVVKMGMRINLADQTVYPQSFKMHYQCIDQIANLWNCPANTKEYDDYGVHAGAGTVGSTEACLLAGLALKFRWREWYAKTKGISKSEVMGVLPNIVISTCFQAAWEKLFKYMDVEPKFVVPSYKTFTVEAADVEKLIDDKTIGVVCIMGNHYGGQYDPVWDVDRMLQKLNKRKSFQVGIHVDAASGGFVAPFQPEVKPWDFRLKSVLSISASGHKFGESVCGTGWIVWRQRKGLSEHVAISVTYLGGKSDSYTLNFSRPASGVYVQFYKLLRLGMEGYRHTVDNMMFHAKELRRKLKSMTYKGKPRFVFLDTGDDNCLPVVTAMLNPTLKLKYDDIDLQHIIAEDHWYVSGYRMGFHDPEDEKEKTHPLFCDIKMDQSMFRVVVKSNLTTELMENLFQVIQNACNWLDENMSPPKAKEHSGYGKMHC